MLLVALQDQRSNVEALLKESGATDLPVLIDPDGGIAGNYSVSGVPTAIIIDKGGKIAQTKVGATTAAELAAAVSGLR